MSALEDALAKAEWWERTCEYWHGQTEARDRIIARLKLDLDDAEVKIQRAREALT